MTATARKPDPEGGFGPVTTVPVYTADESLGIDKGSGIVGFYQASKGGWLIDFEGNRFGAENMKRYVERVMHAWDRHSTRYPTIARMVVPDGDGLWYVASFNPHTNRIDVHKPELLQAWLEMDEIPETELVL